MRHPATLAIAAFLAAATAAADTGPPEVDEILALDAAAGRAIAATFQEETRRRAMSHAARSLASQAGLQRRGWEIARLLDRYSQQLHRIYRFRDLMLREGGFMVQPPVLAETLDAFILARSGASAASAGRVVTILAGEKLVSAVPAWTDFLMRTWPDPAVPASVLFPRDAEEEDLWEVWVHEGWRDGRRLADEIFADDLARLNGIFTGLILWHRLHLAGMVTAPTIGTREVAVAGGGATLRIAERFIAIDRAASLVSDPQQWQAIVTP